MRKLLSFLFGFLHHVQEGVDMEKMERKERQTTPVPTGKGVPWLVFPCGKGQKNQTFCTISSSSSSSNIDTTRELKSIPELRNAKIWCCHYGWLLLTTGDDDNLWILWNPTSYESINLPPLNKKMIMSSIITKPPQNPRCKVVLFEYNISAIWYCHPEDQEWTKHNYRIELLEIDNHEDYDYIRGALLHDLACVDGVIYAQTSCTVLVSIEFDNQIGLQLKGVGLEQPGAKFCTSMYSFLVESFGELLAVYLSITWKSIFGIEVYRWDFSQKVWLQVDKLDGRSIFLGCNKWNSTSCLEAETGIRGNRIYFMMPQDKHLYMYDLEEERILTLLPCPRLQTPWYEPFWVMPVHQLKSPHKALEEHAELVVESQGDIKATADQYPHHLKLDSLTEIAKHLEPLDYLKFRATCRLFRSAAPATQRSITSIMGSLGSPWLVTFSFNKNVVSFTDPIHNNTYHLKVPDSLQGTHINGSKNGYLLMVDGKNLFCYNPFTGMQSKLPTSFTYDDRLSFSSSPSSSDCLMVKVKTSFSPKVDFILPGSDYWDNQPLASDNRAFKMNGLGVFHREMFYYLGRGGNLGVLKVAGGIFSFEILQKPEVPCNAFYLNYLTECDEELMAVFVGCNGSWVKVFRLDHQKMSWMRVRNLGNYTLFVSRISSAAAVAKSSEMENRVYFPRFYNERIVYYSLLTEKFHTHGSDAMLDSFVDTKEQLYCTWIEPARE